MMDPTWYDHLVFWLLFFALAMKLGLASFCHADGPNGILRHLRNYFLWSSAALACAGLADLLYIGGLVALPAYADLRKGSFGLCMFCGALYLLRYFVRRKRQAGTILPTDSRE